MFVTAQAIIVLGLKLSKSNMLKPQIGDKKNRIKINLETDRQKYHVKVVRKLLFSY